MHTFKSYLNGFLLSLALTLGAYFAVSQKIAYVLPLILILAVAQLFVQAVYFLHLNQGQDRVWNSVVFVATAGMIFIVVLGSLWIMSHLNYNMMPMQMQEYIIKEEGIHK